ncbi:VOC family protein [Candidatus Saccharibacteria bacterium]|nr:VOC family protein [Candidatus Saccharibacteria bacterium]
MKLEMFINFDGNCREAAEFYATVFKTDVGEMMTYDSVPPDPNFPVAEEDKQKIVYAGVKVGDSVLMMMDMPSNAPLVVGNNVSPTVSADSTDEVTRLFNELKEGGKVLMDLQKPFFSELYGMVADKFGVIWQILHYTGE